ncbi:MAG: hypothetical protein AAFT19_11620 [Pseudomonadota bacterium]
MWLRALVDRRDRRARRHSKPARALTAQATQDGDAIHVQLGDRSFFLRGPAPIGPASGVFDGAALALAAISASSNDEIRLASPVSPAMAARLDELRYAIGLWRPDGLAPLRLVLDRVDEPAGTALAGRRLLCLSGGVDSTYAAIEAVTRHGFTDAVLVAGADFETKDAPGFEALTARVAGTAERLGLRLHVVETDLRHLPFDWAMLHTLLLGFVLHTTGEAIGAVEGGFAMDNTPVQDLARFPWGNSAAMAWLMGTEHFPIRALGGDLDRVQKLRAIAEHDEALLTGISVCWENPALGRNCGSCRKCTETRLNFLAAGLDEALALPVREPLAPLVDRLAVPKKQRDLRGAWVRWSEIVRHFPPGPLRGSMEQKCNQVRRRLT